MKAIAIAEVLKKYRLPELWNYAIASVELSHPSGDSIGLQWRNFSNQMKAAVITDLLNNSRLDIILLPIFPKEEKQISQSGSYYFTEEDVVNYLQLTGDDNPIHTQDLAIIPGLLLLSFLETKIMGLSLRNFSIRFHEALFMNEKFDIEKRNENEWIVKKGLSQVIITLKISQHESF